MKRVFLVFCLACGGSSAPMTSTTEIAPGGGNVEPDHRDAGSGESHRHRQADIAKPDYRYFTIMRQSRFPSCRPAGAQY